MQLQLNRNATLGIGLSLITGTSFILLSFLMGKENAFLLLNIDLGPIADFLFYIWANAGDGFIWIPAFALTLMYKKKFVPFLMATIVLSTIITQSSKQVFFKSENRPTAVITNASLIHKVPGIEIHTTNSFPSGHTATAFSLFLFCCFISAKKWIVPAWICICTDWRICKNICSTAFSNRRRRWHISSLLQYITIMGHSHQLFQ